MKLMTDTTSTKDERYLSSLEDDFVKHEDKRKAASVLSTGIKIRVTGLGFPKPGVT